MNDIQPFNYMGYEFRVLLRDGEPWFIASDVCRVLGFTNGPDAVRRHVLPGQRSTVVIHDGTSGGNPNKTIISEAGLYRLIMRSNVSGALAFQDWVTGEVLPTIRKTGGYATPGSDLGRAIANGDQEATWTALQASMAVAEHFRKQNERLTPRTIGATAQEDLRNGQSVWDLRDALSQQLNVGPKSLYTVLRRLGVFAKINACQYEILPGWDDLLFTATGLDSRPSPAGIPRIYPGMQSEFMARVREARNEDAFIQ